MENLARFPHAEPSQYERGAFFSVQMGAKLILFGRLIDSFETLSLSTVKWRGCDLTQLKSNLCRLAAYDLIQASTSCQVSLPTLPRAEGKKNQKNL